MHTSLFCTGSFEAARERRLIRQYGGPDIRQLPDAVPSGQETYRNRASQYMDSTRVVQRNADRSPGTQQRTFDAIQANMRRSNEVRDSTFQTGVTYRLGSGAGPGGDGMSEGFRRAQQAPMSRSQMTPDMLQAWRDPMDDPGLLERGFSMGPRRAPPRGSQQMPAGPYGQHMAPQAGGYPMMPMGAPMPYQPGRMPRGPNVNPMVQQGNRFNAGYQPNVLNTGNVETMTDQQVNKRLSDFISAHVGNLSQDIQNIISSIPVETKRAILRVIERVEGPDGQILAGAVYRLAPPGTNMLSVRTRAMALAQVAGEHSQELHRYLSSRASADPRASADLDTFVGFAPAADQAIIRNALSSLSLAEVGALSRVLAYIDTVVQLLRTMPEPPEAVQKQLLAFLQSSGQQQFNTFQPNNFNTAPQLLSKQQYAKQNAIPQGQATQERTTKLAAPESFSKRTAEQLRADFSSTLNRFGTTQGTQIIQKILLETFNDRTPDEKIFAIRQLQGISDASAPEVAVIISLNALRGTTRGPNSPFATLALVPEASRADVFRNPVSIQAITSLNPQQRVILSTFVSNLATPQERELYARNADGIVRFMRVFRS